MAFHFLTHSGCLSSDYGGILPDPITLGDTEVYIDGNLTTNTATNGQEQYLIVKPGHYPMDEQERQRRRGSTR